MFTLVNALLLNPMPIRDMSRVVVIGTSEVRDGAPQFLAGTSRPNFIDLRDQQSVFSGAVLTGFTPLSLSGSGEPEQLFAQIVSGNYFDVLGPPLAAGRTFLPDEDQQLGAHPVVVLSHGLWTRRFGARPGDRRQGPDVERAELQRHRRRRPKAFAARSRSAGPDLWVPFAMYREVLTGLGAEGYNSRRGLIYQAFGRLKDGVTLEQAQANVDGIGRGLAESFPTDNRGRSFALRSLTEAAFPPAFKQQLVLVGQPRHGRGRPGAAHRLRQRRQPAAGAREHAPAGDRGAAVDWRQPAAADPAVPHREPAAGRRWRRRRADRRLLVARHPVGLPSTVPAAGRPRPELRSTRAGVRDGGVGGDGTPLRAGAGAARRHGPTWSPS